MNQEQKGVLKRCLASPLSVGMEEMFRALAVQHAGPHAWINMWAFQASPSYRRGDRYKVYLSLLNEVSRRFAPESTFGHGPVRLDALKGVLKEDEISHIKEVLSILEEISMDNCPPIKGYQVPRP